MTPERFEYLKSVLAKVSFPAYTFVLEMQGGMCFLHVTYNEPDVFSGEVETQHGRLWHIGDNWVEMQLLQTAFKALLTSLEHRARENFLYIDRPIMHPHRTLEEAYEQAAREQRTTTMPEIEFTEPKAPTAPGAKS